MFLNQRQKVSLINWAMEGRFTLLDLLINKEILLVLSLKRSKECNNILFCLMCKHIHKLQSLCVVLYPRCQFQQCFSRSFYMRRSYKSLKRYWQLNWNFTLLGSARVKASCRTLKIWFQCCEVHEKSIKASKNFMKYLLKMILAI